VEVLLASPGVRECLRDHSRLGELRKLIADGRQAGSQTFEQHLAELVDGGLISAETSRAAITTSAAAPSSAKRGGKGGR
jgi:Tfp pilus assembly pilus retraction ATPase PilT